MIPDQGARPQVFWPKPQNINNTSNIVTNSIKTLKQYWRATVF